MHHLPQRAPGFVILSLALGLALAPSLEATTLTVDTQPGFRAGLRVLAVAPIPCPPDLDCKTIERRVEEALGEESGLEVVGADRMREEMDRWGMRELTPGNLMGLTGDVEADAVLTIELFQIGSGEGFRARWSPLNPRGVTFSKSLVRGQEAVGIDLISGRTGETLVKGRATGKKLSGSSAGRTSKALVALIQKAFTR